MTKINYKRGSGLVEILVAIFIFTVVLGSLITASNMYLSGAANSLKSAKAAYIAQEGIEAVKIIGDSAWSNMSAITDNTDYYLYFDTSSSTNNIWKATSTASSIDSIFIRTFKLNSVYRDSNGRIALTGGTLDNNTEKVTVSVSWITKNSTTTKTLVTYITNIL
jgi:Tfp pilus assembly protein PilV